ncbi:MAG: biotin/lipoyl-binding protein [Polyangiaceae bacterium]
MSAWSYRLRDFIAKIAPLGLCVGTLAAAAYLQFGDDLAGGTLLGYAEARTWQVAAPERAQLRELRVEVGTVVHAGDVIALLDTSALDAEIAVARADRDALAASVIAERTRRNDRIDEAIAALERQLAGVKEDQARVGSEAQAVRAERDRVKALVDSKQAVADDLAPLALKEAALVPLTYTKPATAELLKSQIKELGAKRSDSSLELTDLVAKVTLAEEQLRGLERRRGTLTLRASADGTVTEILKRPGEIVDVGAPLIKLVAPTTRAIVCLPDDRPADVTLGTVVRLRPKGATTKPISGKVIASSPLVEELPPQCRVNPHVVTLGREVVVSLDGDGSLTPGQSLEVELGARGSGREAPTVAAPLEGTIRRMKVPASLRETTRFEPSGLVAEPGRDDYLVVSDDTGLDKDRIPMLFRMTGSGDVDATPADISGIDELTDLESITTLDGGVFVLSSQSHSKRGKRPRARTAFLSLKPSGDGFQVAGEVHLIDLLEGLDAASLTALGIASTNDLEIEGMTARGGSIYFGLKAPLDDAGRALIWRLTNPQALFTSNSLKDAGLVLEARVPLDLTTEGGASSPKGGIAELVFTDDKGLLVCSTPSTGDGAFGAVFHATLAKQGDAVANLEKVASFPGRKPEGITPTTGHAGSFLVVFDEGSADPEFTEIAWPKAATP